MGQGAASNELLQLGAMDQFLKKGACVSYWRRRFNKSTNFAMENVCQPFQITPQFGGTSQLTFQRAAELLYYLYVVIDLPAIKAYLPGTSGAVGAPYGYGNSRGYGSTDTPSASASGPTAAGPGGQQVWCHWANAVAQLLIKRAALFVGGHLTDTLYATSLYMWEELSGKAGKRLREMIGKRKTREQLIHDAQYKQRFYVPMPYFFTLSPGNVLPLVNLHHHGVQMIVEWEKLENCIVVSGPGVQVLKDDGTQLTPNDLKAWVDTTYVHLDIDERNRFANANFDQLITQTQLNFFQGKSEVHQVRLSFNHPVIELIWAVRRKVNEDCNNWFNFSGVGGRDPIAEVALRTNNNYRFSGHEGRYYRLVEPYQAHSSLPKSHIYSKSFAIWAEDGNPTGSSNFSRLDYADMHIKLQPELADEYVTIIVVARNHQVMRYLEGHAGPLFRD